MVSARQKACLAAMGVDVWLRRTPETDDVTPPRTRRASAASEAKPPQAETAPARRATAAVLPSVQPLLDWETLATRVSACTACELHQGRTQTVFGTGNRNAEWLIIGEAPGAEEDKRGEPFVGRAGQLLTSMLGALGLPRPQVYIANILKCRPPSNRDPKPDEVAFCEQYLFNQIALLNPRIILAVGRIAAQNLLKTQTPIGKLRGHRHAFGGQEIPVVVTYHPAYLLRSPGEKRRAWEDLLFARQVFESLPPR
ncbi:MAG: uracil-DNA glycosylase [Gammaproteobacteria bacterium]|nr:uracil-DNA glycosylase [Gammaproteobacteria bacterium]